MSTDTALLVLHKSPDFLHTDFYYTDASATSTRQGDSNSDQTFPLSKDIST